MIEEGLSLELDEVIVLNKYEGDLTDEEMETTQPLETVTLKNGVIVDHIIWKEVNN